MKRISILARMILAICVLTLGVALVTSWVGAEVAGDEVERRLVDDMAESCGSLLERLRLPPSPRMLTHLSQVADGDIAVGPPGSNQVVSSTLSAEDLALFRQSIDAQGPPRRLRLSGGDYLLGFYDLDARLLRNQQDRRLYVLIPEARIQAAKDAIRRRISHWTFLVLGVALVITVLLSCTVTGPLRRLTRTIDQLSQRASDNIDALPGLVVLSEPPQGPREVQKLASSFDRLLHTLNAAQERLARAERLAALGKTAASVAHELRNPLSGIKMHLRLLEDALSDDADRESLVLIFREIERMDLFLAELMALAKGDFSGAAQNVSAPHPVHLAAEFQHVAALLEGKLKHAGIDFRLNASAALPAANGDANRIRQVILNLMLNAVEAMPNGGILEGSIVAINDTSLQVRLRDHGIGIAAGLTEDIFDAFVSSRPHGAGLGLHVCRQIIRAHGGEIRYRSHPDGTEFEFELPSIKDIRA